MRRYTRTTATTGETKSEERRVTRLRMRPCCERIWGACVDAAAHARRRAPQEKEEPRRTTGARFPATKSTLHL